MKVCYSVYYSVLHYINIICIYIYIYMYIYIYIYIYMYKAPQPSASPRQASPRVGEAPAPCPFFVHGCGVTSNCRYLSKGGPVWAPRKVGSDTPLHMKHEQAFSEDGVQHISLEARKHVGGFGVHISHCLLSC